MVGYGAAARAVTFLNVVGADAGLVAAVGDRAPARHGRRIPGTGIPVVSPDELRDLATGDVLVLAWDLAREIAPSLAWAEARGRRLVVAMPELATITQEVLAP